MKIFDVTLKEWALLFTKIALALVPAKLLFDLLCALGQVAIVKVLFGG